MRERSTEASVCPARTSTPPFRARKRKHMPGRARSCGLRLRIDGRKNRDGAIGRADSGSDAPTRVNRFGKAVP